MFARKVAMHLKANGAAEFKKRIESEVIPLLRKQAGFLNEITFLYPSGKEVHAFSLWETLNMRRPTTAMDRIGWRLVGRQDSEG